MILKRADGSIMEAIHEDLASASTDQNSGGTVEARNGIPPVAEPCPEPAPTLRASLSAPMPPPFRSITIAPRTITLPPNAKMARQDDEGAQCSPSRVVNRPEKSSLLRMALSRDDSSEGANTAGEGEGRPVRRTLTIPPMPQVSPPMRRAFAGKPNMNRSSPLQNDANSLLAYNQYGEIVKLKDILKPQNPKDLTVTQTLRLINKVYGYEFGRQLRDCTPAQLESEPKSAEKDDASRTSRPLIHNLSSWEYSPFPLSSPPESPEGGQMILVYTGPPRVLELGCGDGAWSFSTKQHHPEWILEGLDDHNYWSEAWPDIEFRDFISPLCGDSPTDYFRGFPLTQVHPEFTIRNLNALLAHSMPLPYNLYGLIRGRDIFSRVESYKEFLEDVRLILQPDGVVEFVEFDPRPRGYYGDGLDGAQEKRDSNAHISRPETDWTDSIADRFKNPHDEELVSDVPGWSARVEARQLATLRPKDGYPAPQLKSWLEGAGFWDVRQVIFRMQIGGDSVGGQLRLQALSHQVGIENGIPLLAEQLPPVEMDALASGKYFLNLHIVTARKPKYPRPGDLLLDGSRQEMTSSKYDVMAKLNGAKSNQWRRFDLDGQLTKMMKSLGAIHGSENTTPLGSPPRPSVEANIAADIAALNARISGKDLPSDGMGIADKNTPKVRHKEKTSVKWADEVSQRPAEAGGKHDDRLVDTVDVVGGVDAADGVDKDDGKP